jgi:hypothetical protein
MPNDPNWCPPAPSSPSTPVADPYNTLSPDTSSLCHIGMTPGRMTGLLLSTLRQLFGSSQNIQNSDLRGYVYTNDDATNQIAIEPFGQRSTKSIGKLPEIIVKRGPYRRQTAWQDTGVYNSDGHTDYLEQLLGSHTIFCTSSNADTADSLAFEIVLLLSAFNKVIVANTPGLKRLVVGDVPSVSLREGATTNYVVPVNLAWITEYAYKLESDANLLDAVHLAIAPSV